MIHSKGSRESERVGVKEVVILPVFICGVVSGPTPGLRGIMNESRRGTGCPVTRRVGHEEEYGVPFDLVGGGRVSL